MKIINPADEPLPSYDVCKYCAAAQFCLPAGSDKTEFTKLDQLTKKQHIIEQGEQLIYLGNEFHSFYAVKNGFLKSYVLDIEGREQIWSFYFLGELFGFEGLEENRYPYSVMALKKSTVCEISYEGLMDLMSTTPCLQRQVFRLMSYRARIDFSQPRNNTAEERLAAFLLSISSRFKRCGFSPTLLELPFTRKEMATYLGLTIETVSRLITRYKKAGIIKTNGKIIEITNLRKLQLYATL